jgi:hypothetical protein
MNILPKFPPSSVRPGSSMPPAVSGTRLPEPRFYLVPAGARRSAPPQKKNLPLFPHESEDARLTGSTRSLFRRLLALNLPVTVTESVTMKSRTTATTTYSKTA